VISAEISGRKTSGRFKRLPSFHQSIVPATLAEANPSSGIVKEKGHIRLILVILNYENFIVLK